MMTRRMTIVANSACLAFVCLWLGTAHATQQPASEDSAPLQWELEYTNDGQLAGWRGPGNKEARFAYERDADQRLKKLTQTLSDGTRVSYDFDRFGRRTGMTDALGNTRYEYDGYNRLTAVHREGLPSLRYGYDTLDRVSSVSVGDSFSVQYRYDFLGRLASQETPAGTISYEYQSGQGAVIRTLPNGIRTIWKYGPDGKLAELTHVSKDNWLLARFRYDYRPDGLIKSIQEDSPQGKRTLSYEYDTVQRLTAVTDSRDGKTEYRYDPLGNRTELLRSGQPTVTSAYDWAGRLTQHNGQPCSHDPAANHTGCSGDDDNRTFTFDDANRLRQAATNRGVVRYDYDGDGNLATRVLGDEKTLFLPDPRTEIWRPMLTIQPDGSQTFFVWEGDVPLAAITGSEATFFLHDHLGSVRFRVDPNGYPTPVAAMSAFGEHRQEAARQSLQPGFTGLFFDSDGSLYLTKARVYDPRLGRFLQRDPKGRIPLGSQEDLSAYVYAANDPMNRIDITGQQSSRAPTYTPMRSSYHVPAGLNYMPITSACGLGDSCRLSVRDLGTNSLPGYSAPQTHSLPATISSTPSPLNPTRSNLSFSGKNLSAQYHLNRPAWASALSFGVQINSPLPFAPNLALSYSPLDHLQGNQPIQASFVYGLSDVVSTVLSKLLPKSSVPISFHVNAPGLNNTFIGSVIESFNQNNLMQNLAPVVRYSAESAAHALFRTPTASSASPSNVGGIYLRGAGEALKDLGPLSGIALDEANGRLILISADKGEIELPPLRLDDVVTVFRSAYEGGDAPFVSIDPDPRNLRGPKMFVRHGEQTEDTYVGWVLFEADRVMKAYSLGEDNVTRKAIVSGVPGYRNLLDPAFADSGNQDRNWERFWIVPASVERLQAKDGRLTLFDVPLKVNTQQMRISRGELVPAEGVSPSAGAEAFSRWFTEHYDAIGQEAKSLPPPQSGIDSPVPVFAELRRIALVAAIAEALRDQGVPFPAWLRDHAVEPVPVTRTTPGIFVKSSMETGGGTLIRKIYGGVGLAPRTEDIREVQDPRAEGMQAELLQAMAAAPLLEPVRFEHDAESYRAVALPGDDTRDVGGHGLTERDLTVPMPGGSSVELVRRFHSFFQPSDVFGGSWTLDLPRLEVHRQPVERTGDSKQYRQVFQLGSPLQTWSVRFTRKEPVPELGAELLVPDRPGEILGLTGTHDPRIGQQTQVVLFRDGRRWHFNEQGALLAKQQAPVLVLYPRDGQGRVQRIEGWYGANDKSSARIDLTYHGKGRLAGAKGSNGEEVVYSYDEAGALIRVERPSGNLDYDYADGLVTAIESDGKPLARFTYNHRGQLQGTWKADGTEVTYSTRSSPEGVTVTSKDATTAQTLEMVQYDPAYRPISRVLADGTRIDWKPAEGDSVQATLRLPNGDTHVMVQTPDGKPTRWQLPEGGTYAAEYDDAGRMTTLNRGDRPLLRQQWQPDGQLAMATYEIAALHPQYQGDGQLGRMLITPPGADSSFDRWLQVDYDDTGHAVAMTDYSGMDLGLTYDKVGRLATLGTKRDGQKQGIEITRNAQGDIESLTTSWGYRQDNAYNKGGELKRVEISEGGAQAAIELDQGRPTRVKQFDGGEWVLSYHEQGSSAGQAQTIRTPNGLDLNYAYDKSDRLGGVSVRDRYRVEYGYNEEGRLASIAQSPPQK